MTARVVSTAKVVFAKRPRGGPEGKEVQMERRSKGQGGLEDKEVQSIRRSERGRRSKDGDPRRS